MSDLQSQIIAYSGRWIVHPLSGGALLITDTKANAINLLADRYTRTIRPYAHDPPVILGHRGKLFPCAPEGLTRQSFEVFLRSIANGMYGEFGPVFGDIVPTTRCPMIEMFVRSFAEADGASNDQIEEMQRLASLSLEVAAEMSARVTSANWPSFKTLLNAAVSGIVSNYNNVVGFRTPMSAYQRYQEIVRNSKQAVRPPLQQPETASSEPIAKIKKRRIDHT